MAESTEPKVKVELVLRGTPPVLDRIKFTPSSRQTEDTGQLQKRQLPKAVATILTLYRAQKTGLTLFRINSCKKNRCLVRVLNAKNEAQSKSRICGLGSKSFLKLFVNPSCPEPDYLDIDHEQIQPGAVTVRLDGETIEDSKELTKLARTIATTGGWSLADYQLNIKHAPPPKDQKHSVSVAAAAGDLPINQWEHFQWTLAGQPRKPLPAKLYGLNCTSVNVEFDALRGLWSPGPVFPDYKAFRDQVWLNGQEKRRREGRAVERDDPIWHVEQIEMITRRGNGSAFRLVTQRALYPDVVATAQDPHLNATVQGRTVQMWLASGWKPGDPARPFYSAANQLMVLLMVITKDGKALLARQGTAGAGSKSIWANSVVGHVHGYDDNDNLERPDPTKTASREAIEEIGLVVKPADVRWMALAVGLKFGSYGLHGEVACNLTAEEIERNFLTKPTKPGEIGEISFVDLKPSKVAERLQVKDYTNLCELGLALCLWRRGLAEIVFPPRSDKWAYAE